jgi:hypothetical protein
VVAGQVTQSAPKTAERESGGKGEWEKNPHAQVIETNDIDPATEDTQAQVLLVENLQSPYPTSPIPYPEDDDEEVSWQNAARASLEKETKTSSTPVAKKVENPSPKVDAKPVETRATPQASSEPPTLNPEPPPPTEQFTREELPADFWGSESEPPPTSNYDDEAFETATSAPSGNGQVGRTRGVAKPNVKLPFEMPLFNELQSLFPGRIVRIDVKQQKQAEESEEDAPQANEAVSVVESEENDS